MQKIKKVIFDDDTELELEGLKPISDFKSAYGYRGQFRDFEDTILDYIDEDRIERYAEWSLDMVKSDDCECDCDEEDISDYTDNQLIDEISRRYFGNKGFDIITNSLFDRFTKVLVVADKSELDEIIKNQEVKHNLI